MHGSHLCLPAVALAFIIVRPKFVRCLLRLLTTPYVTAETLIPPPRRRTNHFPRAHTRRRTCHTYGCVLPLHGKRISVESPCIQLHLAATRWSRERLTPRGSSNPNDANCAAVAVVSRGRADIYIYIFPYEDFQRQWFRSSAHKLRVIAAVPSSSFSFSCGDVQFH